MNTPPVIVIIIPVYNEQQTVHSVLHGLKDCGYCQLVVVDDGSDEPLTLQSFKVHHLRHAINLGQGAAIQTGIEYTRNLDPDVIVTFDADGQHDPADIGKLIKPILNDEADIVFGSRFLHRATDAMPTLRRFVVHCARVVNFLLTGILLSDAHNGLRAFGRRAYYSLSLTENRMAHASEILFKTKALGLRYKERAVNVRYSPYTLQKGQSGWDSINILFDLLLHKIMK